MPMMPGQPPMTGQMPMQSPMTMPSQTQMQSPMVQGAPTVMSPGYVPGYLKSLIGKYILAEFLIGTNTFVDRYGQLLEVGTNYFVLRDVNFNTTVMCDLYSVRFVTVLGSL
jgi:hypothetical protein